MFKRHKNLQTKLETVIQQQTGILGGLTLTLSKTGNRKSLINTLQTLFNQQDWKDDKELLLAVLCQLDNAMMSNTTASSGDLYHKFIIKLWNALFSSIPEYGKTPSYTYEDMIRFLDNYVAEKHFKSWTDAFTRFIRVITNFIQAGVFTSENVYSSRLFNELILCTSIDFSEWTKEQFDWLAKLNRFDREHLASLLAMFRIKQFDKNIYEKALFNENYSFLYEVLSLLLQIKAIDQNKVNNFIPFILQVKKGNHNAVKKKLDAILPDLTSIINFNNNDKLIRNKNNSTEKSIEGNLRFHLGHKFTPNLTRIFYIRLVDNLLYLLMSQGGAYSVISNQRLQTFAQISAAIPLTVNLSTDVYFSMRTRELPIFLSFMRDMLLIKYFYYESIPIQDRIQEFSTILENLRATLTGIIPFVIKNQPINVDIFFIPLGILLCKGPFFKVLEETFRTLENINTCLNIPSNQSTDLNPKENPLSYLFQPKRLLDDASKNDDDIYEANNRSLKYTL